MEFISNPTKWNPNNRQSHWKKPYSESHAKMHTCCRYILNVHVGFPEVRSLITDWGACFRDFGWSWIFFSIRFQCIEIDLCKEVLSLYVCVSHERWDLVYGMLNVCALCTMYIVPWIEYIDIDIAIYIQSTTIIFHRLTEYSNYKFINSPNIFIHVFDMIDFLISKNKDKMVRKKNVKISFHSSIQPF